MQNLTLCFHNTGWRGDKGDYKCYRCSSKISDDQKVFMEKIWKGRIYIQKYKLKNKLDLRKRLFE